MAVEIERKFLVSGDAWKIASGSLIRQGYLSRDPERTVRVRVSGDSAWLCVKGLNHGMTRSEFEYSIPRADAAALLAMCAGPLIEKTRHRVDYAGHCWEIDEFHGQNAGLVVAEVELAQPTDMVDFPPWIGAEVTEDARYFNSNLASCPYSLWAGKTEHGGATPG